MRDWLSHRAAATPAAPALIAAGSGTEWTYAELDGAVDELAARLASFGVGAGDHLVTVLEPRVEYVTLIHAAMRLGVRLVPLSHRLTERELSSQIDQADATALVCGAETAQSVTAATPADVPLASLDETSHGRVTQVREVEPVPIEPVEWDRPDPVLLLFTSGTTGTPKGVDIRLSNVLSSTVVTGFRLGVSPEDRWLATLPFHHAGGIMPVYRTALYGTTLIVRAGFDPGGAADDLREYEATGVSLVPTMLHRMLDRRGTLADSLRVVLLGGAPAPDSLIERCRDFSVPVYPTYGMTETCSAITIATADEAATREGTVGRPLLWTDLSVRNEEGEELPPGEIGEFVVSGPTVARGYYDDPAATAAAFSNERLRTGDIGYQDPDGYVYVLNRKDDRINTGGELVDPGEVEGVLQDHEDVTAAIVVGLPDEDLGQRVGAAIVPAEPDLDGADLEAFARERLAGFKLPRTVRFLDELPRTDSGTVDRAAVIETLADTTGSPGDVAGSVWRRPDENGASGTTSESEEPDEPDQSESEDGEGTAGIDRID